SSRTDRGETLPLRRRARAVAGGAPRGRNLGQWSFVVAPGGGETRAGPAGLGFFCAVFERPLAPERRRPLSYGRGALADAGARAEPLRLTERPFGAGGYRAPPRRCRRAGGGSERAPLGSVGDARVPRQHEAPAP